LEPAAVEMLCQYDWPGNVRELENIVARASVLNVGGPITAESLRGWLAPPRAAASDQSTGAANGHGDTFSPGLSLETMERKLIEATLDHFDGHRAKTAHALGIGLRTLSGKLKQYGYAPRAKVFTKTP
jgi:DNA-binding NtrC family response regulator